MTVAAVAVAEGVTVATAADSVIPRETQDEILDVMDYLADCATHDAQTRDEIRAVFAELEPDEWADKLLEVLVGR